MPFRFTFTTYIKKHVCSIPQILPYQKTGNILLSFTSEQGRGSPLSTANWVGGSSNCHSPWLDFNDRRNKNTLLCPITCPHLSWSDEITPHKIPATRAVKVTRKCLFLFLPHSLTQKTFTLSPVPWKISLLNAFQIVLLPKHPVFKMSFGTFPLEG